MCVWEGDREGACLWMQRLTCCFIVTVQCTPDTSTSSQNTVGSAFPTTLLSTGSTRGIGEKETGEGGGIVDGVCVCVCSMFLFVGWEVRRRSSKVLQRTPPPPL